MLQSQCKLSSWIFIFPSSFIYSFSEQSSLPMCHTLEFLVTSTPIKKERHLEYHVFQDSKWTNGQGVMSAAERGFARQLGPKKQTAIQEDFLEETQKVKALRQGSRVKSNTDRLSEQKEVDNVPPRKRKPGTFNTGPARAGQVGQDMSCRNGLGFMKNSNRDMTSSGR